MPNIRAALNEIAAHLETAQEVCARAGLSERGLDLALREGRAPEPVRVGRQRLFVRGEIDAWLRLRSDSRDGRLARPTSTSDASA